MPRGRPVICLMGPTACGKSGLALEMGERLNCEIVSVDSVLVYRGMDIGTAKPSRADRARIPHHLIDILDPTEVFSTGRFRRSALELIRAIRERGKTPLLVGGTMLYFKALLRGLAPLPEADPGIRAEIECEAARIGWREMHRKLALVDPVSAARIHPNDPQRIQRALEVYRVSGRSLTELCGEGFSENQSIFPVKLKIVAADRHELHRRIELRFRQMLDSGMIEEVETMRRRGDLNPTLPSIRAVGYRQVWSYLSGEIDRMTMIEKGIAATRQLAKRQMTWLRKESAQFLYEMECPELANLICSQVEPFMHSYNQT
ncbi:MAG: tRNA (adenosine(37)-N6)-dimethylallyltransferase MiaA [Gammaproteobacteria bacterium]